MSLLFATALTTGILSGFWMFLANSLSLLGWAGFLGCTTYFASPDNGIKGLITGVASNMSGVFWAMVIIMGTELIPFDGVVYIITAVIAFFMCFQAKNSLLKFIPGTFIGSCATFATEGNWRLVIPSLILGLIFGFLMKSSGFWLKQVMKKEKRA